MKCISAIYYEPINSILFTVNSGNNEYLILINNDHDMCTCLGYEFHKDEHYKCKHIKFLFDNYFSCSYHQDVNDLRKNNNVNGYNKMKFLRTGLSSIDNLLSGIPKSIPLGLVGAPESGKTTLAIQLGFDVLFKSIIEDKKLAEQLNSDSPDEITSIIFIDGEGGLYNYFATHWVEVFNRKYNSNIGVDHWEFDYESWKLGKSIKTGKNKGKRKEPHKTLNWKHVANSKKAFRVHVIDLIGSDGFYALDKLNLIVGKPQIKVISEKGKYTIKDHPTVANFENIKYTPIGKFIDEHNSKFLLLDSLTMPIEACYSTDRESFPARSKNNMKLCVQLQQLSAVYELYCIVTHHLTKDPANAWDRGKMTGSKGTRHSFKFQLLIEQYGSNTAKRWVSILRSPNKGIKGLKTKFEITGNGIQDILE